MANMTLVNLGCGPRFRPGWMNYDFVSRSPQVIRANLLRPLPISDESADFIYTSHVLEHFMPLDAGRFLSECWRILSPQGTIRISVPDLEFLTRQYLRSLTDNSLDAERHLWFISELIDQLAREKSGGMKRALIADGGEQYRSWLGSFTNTEITRLISTISAQPNRSARQQIRALLDWLTPEWVRVGRFRMSGEPHKWMYDKVTLPQMLRSAGFQNVQQRDYLTSDLPNWSDVGLDNEGDLEYKPGSIYFEANKSHSATQVGRNGG